MIKVCWYCKYFVSTNAYTPFGECRRNAPSGADVNIVHPSVELKVFPQIFYSNVEWCGDYNPCVEERPAPPWS